MASDSEESPGFTLDDLLEHVEQYGVDLFPPVDVSMDTVRAEAFFAELRDRWPHLFASMTLGPAEFKIATTFQFSGGKQASIDTFALTGRGPVFTFPQRMGAFNEIVDLRGANTREVFEECLGLFLRSFPGRQVLRLGLVRQLILGTGRTDCTSWLGSAVLQFDSGQLTGAQALLVYEDGAHNIRIQMEPVNVMSGALVPATGQVVGSTSQFGLAVIFDVNNRELRPLTPEDRRAVLDRANQLWPAGLLRFLNQRRLS